MRRSFFLAALLAAAALAAPSCGETPAAVRCKDIPPGGCPLSHGVACDDPACEAAYACVNEKWELDHTCPRKGDAAASADASIDAAIPGDAVARDVSVPDGAFGGPGCADLQIPDCSLGAALACSSCCGCEDVFVCASGGWTLWGTCSNGTLTPR